MDRMDYFMELYGNLPRAGPGDNASTRKAYDMIEDMPPEPRILDIGCGPGIQTMEIARLSGGTVLALDLMPQMINRVKETAAEQGMADRIEIIKMDMNKMDFAIESFDLIWSEGSIYLMGFKNGLEKVRNFLKPGGYVAVTEAVWLKPNPPDEVVKFWEAYPDISIIDKKLKVIADLGYQEIGHFVIPDTSWTEPYYEPLEERSKEFEVVWKDKPVAMEVIQEARIEIEMFRKYHEFYGYCFFVMRKSLSAK
jgi:cyclopropane fatty-acyl-phospholipid synthase-like methyltransferase